MKTKKYVNQIFMAISDKCEEYQNFRRFKTLDILTLKTVSTKRTEFNISAKVDNMISFKKLLEIQDTTS